MKDFEFSFPTQIIFGADAEEKIGALSQKYGHRAMIITEANVSETMVCMTGLPQN